MKRVSCIAQCRQTGRTPVQQHDRWQEVIQQLRSSQPVTRSCIKPTGALSVPVHYATSVLWFMGTPTPGTDDASAATESTWNHYKHTHTQPRRCQAIIRGSSTEPLTLIGGRTVNSDAVKRTQHQSTARYVYIDTRPGLALSVTLRADHTATYGFIHVQVNGSSWPATFWPLSFHKDANKTRHFNMHNHRMW